MRTNPEDGLTCRVTGSVIAVPTTQEPALTMIEPLYKPAGRPAEFAMTVSVPGRTPVEGLTESHPLSLVAVVANDVAPALQVSKTVCGAGIVPPVSVRKDSEAGLYAKVCVVVELTISVTVTICDVLHAPTPKIVTVPL